MKITTIPVGPLHANCYLVYEPGREDCVLIDPGDNPQKILLEAAGKKIAAILLTHGHFDHVSAVNAIGEVSGCPVYIHEKDTHLPPRLSGGDHAFTDYYRDGDVLQFAGMEFRIMETPGHSAGSVCIVTETTIFSGDTLFDGTCGRTDLESGSWDELAASLKRLTALPGDYTVCPGHGTSTTLDAQRQSNPYLR